MKLLNKEKKTSWYTKWTNNWQSSCSHIGGSDQDESTEFWYRGQTWNCYK